MTPRRLSHVRMIAELHASRPARSLEHVLPPTWRGVLREWLAADAPTFDVGGFVVGDSHEEAVLLVKGAPGGSGGVVLAGVPFVTALFQEELGCSVEWLMAEGDVLTPPCAAAVVRGPARKLLLGERTALNILSRACGVATAARALADAARSAGWRGAVAGTRKVTPGFRLVEKYALLVGGAATHRMDLSHMVMLKGAWMGEVVLRFKAGKKRRQPRAAANPPPPPYRQPCVVCRQHRGRGGCRAQCVRLFEQDRGGGGQPGGGPRGCGCWRRGGDAGQLRHT